MIFKAIRNVEPDLFIWLGDAVYLDRGLEKRWNWKTMGYDRIERGLLEKKQIFEKTKYGDREYQKLRESVPIIGVWDDHDFGMDNSGKDYKNKDVAKTLFLDFLDEPMNSARRITHDGTNQDYYVTNQNIKVHIILLDVRYNMIPEVDALGEN